MSTDGQGDNIDNLAALAGEKVRLERERFESASARRARSGGMARIASAVVVFAAFAGTAVTQLPRFQEPFDVPAMDSDLVAQADVAEIGDMVFLFQLAQGRVPASLDEVNLPEGLRGIARSGLTYAPEGASFKLVYKLSQRQVEYDGASGKLLVRDVR